MMNKIIFLAFMCAIFLSCSSEEEEDLFLAISEREYCNEVEYNPKIQFCSNDKIFNKGEFIDVRDGQIYRFVEIGEQIWMAENLNYEVTESKCYNNNPDYCNKCGRLYNWNTAMQGICPDGWHLPSSAEWRKLQNYVGEKGAYMYGFYAGKKLKTKSDWKDLNGNKDSASTDEYGFSALPCGESFVGIMGNWWSFADELSAIRWLLEGGSDELEDILGSPASNLYYVRCVKGEGNELSNRAVVQ